jgi:hypothetical protein
LGPLELALIAEFNLEMAAAYDEVAESPTARRATREAARESAARRRERAQLFQLEARRASAYPGALALPTMHEQWPYVGPERRQGERRTGERRRLRPRPPDPRGQAERRIDRDRRQDERRRSNRIVTEQ